MKEKQIKKEQEPKEENEVLQGKEQIYQSIHNIIETKKKNRHVKIA